MGPEIHRVRDYCTTFAIEAEALITSVNTVGERIAWARAQRKMTQAALAQASGVSQSAIASYEAGHRGRPRELPSIARALGADFNWLDSGEGDWEGAEPPLGSHLQKSFVHWATEAGVQVRELTAADMVRMPPFIQELFGNRYIPDIEVRLPDRARPILVELKGPHTKPDRLAPYLYLANQHPDEYAVFMADFSKPRLGIDEFLQRLGAGGSSAVPHYVADANGTVVLPAEEQRTSYGMTPILAWDHPNDLPEGEFVMIPRLDVHLSAGGGRDQVEIELTKENPQAFRSEWIRGQGLKANRLACMRASGDSMERTLHDGDSLLVDTSQTNVVDGKVYALWYDGGERVKRLFRQPGGGLRIASDNQDKITYPDIFLKPEEMEYVRIIGRVVHRSGPGGL